MLHVCTGKWCPLRIEPSLIETEGYSWRNRTERKSNPFFLSIQREDLKDPEHFVQLYTPGTEKRRLFAAAGARICWAFPEAARAISVCASAAARRSPPARDSTRNISALRSAGSLRRCPRRRRASKCLRRRRPTEKEDNTRPATACRKTVKRRWSSSAGQRRWGMRRPKEGRGI